MNVIPTSPALGAEINGIDLSKEVSAADREFIVKAYSEHLVLLFRGQKLSFDDLLRLREVFGPPGKAANQLLGLGRKKCLPDEVPDRKAKNCSTNCGRIPCRTNTPGTTSGESAISSCGITAAPCIIVMRSHRMRAG